MAAAKKKKKTSATNANANANANAISRTFKTKVAPEDENFLVKLPFDVREVFGQARPPIIIAVGDYSFRWTVAAYGGESFIGFRKSHRVAAKLVPGKTITITITRDDAPRTVDVPNDLAAALTKDKALHAAWSALSFSHQKEHAEALEGAKKPETRTRRLENTLAMLGASKTKTITKPKTAAKKPVAKKPAAKKR